MLRLLRIGLHVEGNSDDDFLRPLLRRMAELCSPPNTAISIVTIARRARSAQDVAAAFCDAYAQRAIDIACIHRDGDSHSREGAVRRDVESICQSAGGLCALQGSRCVPIIPFRAIEAWSLADQDALRDVFGVTDLPDDWPAKLANVEQITDPKQALRDLGKAIRRRRRRLQPLMNLAESLDIETLRRSASFDAAWTAFAAACETALTRPSSAPR
jgi:hypothetical protein